MPMYSALCEVCKTPQTYFQTVGNRASTPTCCEQQMTKTLDSPMVSAMAWSGWKGFYANGQYIEDGAQYKKFLAKNDFIPASEGHQEAAIQKRNKEIADDKKLTAAVTSAVLSNQPKE